MNSNTAASKCREEARLNKQTDGTTDWTLTSKSHTGRLMKNTKAPQETDEEFACPRARGTELQVTIKQSGSSLGGNVFRCGQCSKNFNQRSTLQNHVCSRLARYPFKCGYCCKGFAQPNELRSHAIIHTSEKPFKCGFCARSFAGATTLNNHIRTHTGERPFSCQKCDKTFAQASQLSRHQRFSDSCLEWVEVYTARCQSNYYDIPLVRLGLLYLVGASIPGHHTDCHSISSSWFHLQRHSYCVVPNEKLWRER